MKKPVIYAHRGASAYAPENTMAAFKKALEMGAQGIELDIHLTGDGHVVVAHDEALGRTCNGSGVIEETELKKLMDLDFGYWFSEEFEGEKIPLLTDVIDLVRGKGIILNIEIKASRKYYNPGLGQKTARIVRDYGIQDFVIVSSFNHYSLLDIRKESPEIVTAPLYVGLFADIWDYCKKIGAAAVHPCFTDVVPEMIVGCKKNGLTVNVWTVDKEDDIKEAASMGVDGIITNVPDKALKAVGFS
jgi:glycerophosphoryl diester phosphodiesterase